MRNTQPRTGFTLLELLVVLAMLLILAAVTLPSFTGLRGNADQKAAADQVRARIADARGLAMEKGIPYRLAVYSDGTKIRLAPDGIDFAELPASDQITGSSAAVEQTFQKVTVGLYADPESPQPHSDDSGWLTVATFLPDGTCKEDSATIEVREPGFPPMRLRIRGVTGTAKVMPLDTSPSTAMTGAE